MAETITLEQALDLISDRQSEIIVANNNLIDSIIKDQEQHTRNLITEEGHRQADELLNDIDNLSE